MSKENRQQPTLRDEVIRRFLVASTRSERTFSDGQEKCVRLTKQELALLFWLSEGFTTAKVLAAKLAQSETAPLNTQVIKNRFTALYKKFDIAGENRSDARALALLKAAAEFGIIPAVIVTAEQPAALAHLVPPDSQISE